MVDLDVIVVVPRLAAPVPHLHEAHAALDQAPGDQQLPRLRSLAVHLPDVLGLAVNVEHIRRLHLHPVRQLERLDSCLELRVLLSLGRMFAVELLNEIQLAPLFAQREATVLDVFDQLVDRCVPGVDVRALIDARQKTGLPVL